MNKLYDIAIVGATGAVGSVFLKLLANRKFSIRNLYLLASDKSANVVKIFNNKEYKIISLKNFDFSLAQIAFFSAGANVSKEYAPKAWQSGCVVIDNTSQFRYENNIPLVVPEVNSKKNS